MKAKYFPQCEFLDAQIGNNPSYIWRSILAGQQVLKSGVTRTIGNGRDTKIWGWPWLSDSANPSLQTPAVIGLTDAKVSSLLDGQGNWDLDLLRDLFLPNDVQRIFATLVSQHLKDT